jgi:hypothetical protein
MKSMITILGMATLLATTTGCVKVVEGNDTFTVSGQRLIIIGPSIEQVEAAVPAGATITNVGLADSFFGLIQIATISGTK